MSNLSDRVNDAYKAANTVERLVTERTSLNEIIIAAEKTLEDLGLNQTPSSAHVLLLQLGTTRGYALKLKLRGLLKIKRNHFDEVNISLKQELNLLRSIFVCPICSGTGEFIDHNYERFSRQIHATTSTNLCENCGGTGRIDHALIFR